LLLIEESDLHGIVHVYSSVSLFHFQKNNRNIDGTENRCAGGLVGKWMSSMLNIDAEERCLMQKTIADCLDAVDRAAKHARSESKSEDGEIQHGTFSTNGDTELHFPLGNLEARIDAALDQAKAELASPTKVGSAHLTLRGAQKLLSSWREQRMTVLRRAATPGKGVTTPHSSKQPVGCDVDSSTRREDSGALGHEFTNSEFLLVGEVRVLLCGALLNHSEGDSRSALSSLMQVLAMEPRVLKSSADNVFVDTQGACSVPKAKVCRLLGEARASLAALLIEGKRHHDAIKHACAALSLLSHLPSCRLGDLSSTCELIIGALHACGSACEYLGAYDEASYARDSARLISKHLALGHQLSVSLELLLQHTKNNNSQNHNAHKPRRHSKDGHYESKAADAMIGTTSSGTTSSGVTHQRRISKELISARFSERNAAVDRQAGVVHRSSEPKFEFDRRPTAKLASVVSKLTASAGATEAEQVGSDYESGERSSIGALRMLSKQARTFDGKTISSVNFQASNHDLEERHELVAPRKRQSSKQRELPKSKGRSVTASQVVAVARTHLAKKAAYGQDCNKNAVSTQHDSRDVLAHVVPSATSPERVTPDASSALARSVARSSLRKSVSVGWEASFDASDWSVSENAKQLEDARRDCVGSFDQLLLASDEHAVVAECRRTRARLLQRRS